MVNPARPYTTDRRAIDDVKMMSPLLGVPDFAEPNCDDGERGVTGAKASVEIIL